MRIKMRIKRSTAVNVSRLLTLAGAVGAFFVFGWQGVVTYGFGVLVGIALAGVKVLTEVMS